MAAIDLRGKTPVATFQNMVTTDGLNISDGSGSQIRFLNVTASFAQSASVQTTAEISSSFASSSISSSYSQTGFNFTASTVSASVTLITNTILTSALTSSFI